MILTASVAACAGPQVQPAIAETSGARLGVAIGRTNSVSAAPPKGARIVDAQTWLVPVGADRGIVLRVHRGEVPEGGSGPYVDSLLLALGKAGQAGVERDEPLRIGDLDGRAVEAVELRNRPAMALWLVLAEAEDGLYTATAYGQRDDLRSQAAMVRAFLSSLRVERPDGAERIPVATTATDPLE
ncbi:MAG: hypothetical protein FJ100_18465 [Deltaproteobacteria bacterium]|nr:hypothetical protein [Deltaproteobacteria bacterium]